MAGSPTTTRDLFFAQAPAPALLLDPSGAIVAANAAATALFDAAGLTVDAGRSFGDVLDRSGSMLWAIALSEIGHDGTLEPILVGLGGEGTEEPEATRRQVLLTARATANEDGDRAAVLVTMMDVGRRLSAERHAGALAGRYRSIMQTAGDAILLLDSAGRVELSNQAAAQMFGAHGESFRGRDIAELVADDSRLVLAAAVVDARSRPGEDMVVVTLTCARLDDGSPFPAALTLGSFAGPGGDCTTAVIRDETEAAQLRRDLELKARQLSAKNEELEAFTYSVSHALKAPLRTMGSFAGLLTARYRDQLDETGQRYLTFLSECCDEQSQQIEQLLELSRRALSDDAFAPVDIGEITRRIVTYHVDNATGRAIDIRYTVAMPTIIGQRAALYHLFDNLIGNAVKFTAREPQATVEIGYLHEAGRHHFWVRDNGVGIAEENHEGIFRLFARLHRREEFEGTGAGLNIVRKILERHGGHIVLDSALGAGSTFHVYIPDPPPETEPS